MAWQTIAIRSTERAITPKIRIKKDNLTLNTGAYKALDLGKNPKCIYVQIRYNDSSKQLYIFCVEKGTKDAVRIGVTSKTTSCKLLQEYIKEKHGGHENFYLDKAAINGDKGQSRGFLLHKNPV